MKMTLNGKTLYYKVVDLVESYIFHIKFTSIRVQTKNYKYLKEIGPLPPWPTAVGRRVPTSVPHDARSIVLQFFFRTIYFCKKEEKM
jgi:hypothetical protein